MKLGESVQITVGVSDIGENIKFYETLGFRLVTQSEEPWPWVIFTDGNFRILVNQDGNIYSGLNYFTSKYDEVKNHIISLGIKPVAEVEVVGTAQTIFKSPDEFMFGIINAGKDNLEDKKSEEPFLLGELGEFSYKVTDLDMSIAFWEKLGFDCKHKSDDPYDWGILYDGMVPLGLHNSSDNRIRPELTYFAKDQSEGRKRVEENNIRIVEGTTSIGIEGPDGQRVNIFEWEGPLEYKQ